MSDRITYTLKFPVTVAGQVTEALSLRRPKARDLIRANKIKDDLEKIATMIGDLAEVTPAMVQELDAADFAAVGELVGNFMTAQDA
jgi:hypothetical protein